MKSLKTAFIVILTSLGMVNPVLAFPGGHGSGMHGRHSEMFAELIAAKLDLNDEQVAKFESVRSKMDEIRRDNSPERSRVKQEFINLVTAPTLDQTALLTLFDEKHAAMREAVSEAVAVVAEFTNSLTVEQKLELGNLLEKRFERVSGRR